MLPPGDCSRQATRLSHPPLTVISHRFSPGTLSQRRLIRNPKNVPWNLHGARIFAEEYGIYFCRDASLIRRALDAAALKETMMRKVFALAVFTLLVLSVACTTENANNGNSNTSRPVNTNTSTPSTTNTNTSTPSTTNTNTANSNRGNSNVGRTNSNTTTNRNAGGTGTNANRPRNRNANRP